MRLQILPLGPLGANCVIVWDEASKEGFVVDPGDEPEIILDFIKKHGIKAKGIICTHAHFDHVGALTEIKEQTGARVMLHEAELELYIGVSDQAAFWGYDLEPLPQPDVLLDDGDVIEADNFSFRVIHTPGHSPGGICLYGQGFLISGDTLFAGSIGRTDFFGGSMKEIKESLKKIASLPPDTAVIPGHGPATTIGDELKENPFYQELPL